MPTNCTQNEQHTSWFPVDGSCRSVFTRGTRDPCGTRSPSSAYARTEARGVGLSGRLRKTRLYALCTALALLVVVSAPVAGSATVERTGAAAAPAPALPLALGQDHTCAATSSGGVKCWGVDQWGQLGNGRNGGLGQIFSPQPVSGISGGVRALGAGGSDTCALTSGGADVCWGYNTNGELGNGTINPSNVPVTVSGLGTGVTALAVGAGNLDPHSCAVAANGGAVECWGFEPLGDGTTNSSRVPVKVAGLPTDVAAVSAGEGGTSCALTAAGAVWCWGINQIGQVGDGTTRLRLTAVPVQSLGSGVVAIAAGSSFSCALTSAGAVLCWGDNRRGQLGDGVANGPGLCLGGVRPCSLVPVAVSGLGSGVVAITAGGDHACALTNAGAVRCWGDNSSGELGNGGVGTKCFGPSPNGVCSNVPVAVSGLSSGVVVVAAGELDTCARLDTGGVDCWGDNGNGELGDGTTTGPRLTPVPVVGLVQSVSVTLAGDGTGTVGSSPAGVDCGTRCTYRFDQGSTVTLSAQPASGSRFGGWSGACTGIGSCSLSLTAARSVSAIFTRGASSGCVVPDVRRETLAAAKTAITRAGCSVGKVTRAASKKVKKGRVISESPRPGAKLARGATVAVVVSKGPQKKTAPKTTKTGSSSALSVFATKIEADLAQLANGRAKLASTLTGVASCSISPAAAATQLAAVIANREQTLRALAGLPAPTAQAARIKTLLQQALTASIASDRDYQTWLRSATACPLPHNAGYLAAQRANALATAAKRRFLAAFNPLARGLHLRTWSASRI